MESLADIGQRDARIGAVAESARRNGIENIGIVGGYVRDALTTVWTGSSFGSTCPPTGSHALTFGCQ